jgi:hypothetical protein
VRSLRRMAVRFAGLLRKGRIDSAQCVLQILARGGERSHCPAVPHGFPGEDGPAGAHAKGRRSEGRYGGLGIAPPPRHALRAG